MQTTEFFRSLRQSWWVKILAEHDTEPSELCSAATKIVLGVQLLFPTSTFQGRAFDDLRAVPEWALGLILFTIGTAHAYALRDGSVKWRKSATWLGGAIWFLFAITFLHTIPTSFTAWLFVMFFLGSIWCYVRLNWLGRISA